ncbi:MAG: TIGR04551 family protein [Proteobacteria bacterium]|nr:TIGR04551 family protein [Pseudomonadota bacterium]
MIRKYTAVLGLLFTIVFLLQTARAQDDPGAEADKKAPDTPETSSGEQEEGDENKADIEEDTEKNKEESDEQGGESTEDVDEMDEEGEEDEEDEEEPLELDTPKTADLDMSALGEIDPEKELAEGGAIDEDVAAANVSEDWTERELDILEIHGYFRLRPELYHKFYIRNDEALYDTPMTRSGQYREDEGNDCRDGDTRKVCKNNTLAGANLRFRLEPTLNVSEEVWVKAQIDFLDNVMLGSTPRFWQNWGLVEKEMVEAGRVQGWDMGAPDSSDMVVVRRAWGEVLTPFGQLRFGRMGDHWGLGMLHNSGNGLNQDFGDSVDRIMFAAKINDWLIAPAFDFPNEGVSASDASGRPFDVSQLDDAYQLVGIVAYKHDKEEQLAMIRRGDWLINTGLYFTYRWQVLSFEEDTGAEVSEGDRFFRRDMWSIIPDFWFQFLYDTFHLELEAALVYGELGNPDRNLTDFGDAQALTLIQSGGVIQVDYGLLSDSLRLALEFGFAMGDNGVEGLRAPATYDQLNNPTDNTYTAFSFNPAYNTDLILYHHILGSVSQSYYAKVWLRYDFLKSAMGRQLGIQVDALYSRAVFAKSTINNDTGNIGVELAAQASYQSDDGFFAGVQYGVLFPLGVFKGTPEWDEEGGMEEESPFMTDMDLSIPQTIQILLGITY